MKNMNIKNIFLALFLISTAAIVSSCNYKQTNKADNTEQNAENQQEETSNVKKIVKKDSEDSHARIDYDIEYLNPNDQQSININSAIALDMWGNEYEGDDFIQIAEKAYASEKATIEKNLQEDIDDFGGEYDNLEYYISRKGTFSKDASDKVITHITEINDYSGGAHGSYYKIYTNFDKQTYKKILLTDILNTAKENEILDLMLKQLLKDNKVKTAEELMEKTAILSVSDLFLTENFLIGKNGLTFHFGQYEIAPYAAGTTEITIDYTSLKPYLTGILTQ